MRCGLGERLVLVLVLLLVLTGAAMNRTDAEGLALLAAAALVVVVIGASIVVFLSTVILITDSASIEIAGSDGTIGVTTSSVGCTSFCILPTALISITAVVAVAVAVTVVVVVAGALLRGG